MVDEKKIALRPAVEISYMSKHDQEELLDVILLNEATPSEKQAKDMRELSEKGLLERNKIEEILSEEKGNQKEQITFNRKRIEDVLPSELLKKDKRYIEQYIINALINYSKDKKLERGDAYDLNM